MRQLCGDIYSSVETRRQRTLPLQCLRPLLQDERGQQAARETKELESGEFCLAARQIPLKLFGIRAPWRSNGPHAAATISPPSLSGY